MARVWADEFVGAVCDYLKERRIELGLTIYRVAQASGVSWQSISAYETHNRRPTLDCLAKVSLALGLPPSELLNRVERRFGLPLPQAAEREAPPVRKAARKGTPKRKRPSKS